MLDHGFVTIIADLIIARAAIDGRSPHVHQTAFIAFKGNVWIAMQNVVKVEAKPICKRHGAFMRSTASSGRSVNARVHMAIVVASPPVMLTISPRLRSVTFMILMRLLHGLRQ